MSSWIVENAPVIKELERDDEGHRNYSVQFRVETDNYAAGVADGPQRILTLTPGLPRRGTIWSFDADVDLWAYCTQYAKVVSETPGEPSRFWLCDFKFTTKPTKTDQDKQDPFFEPPIVSGGFKPFTEEAVWDRNGIRITNSVFEPIRGPQNEWEMLNPLVSVSQNSVVLGIRVFAPMAGTLNSRPLWGFPARCIRLSGITWTEKYHKNFKYYNRKFDFEVFTREDDDGNIVSGWDRNILDEGNKVLRGEWRNLGTDASPTWTWRLIGNPRRNNPADLVRFKDTNENPISTILDGTGRPYNPNLAEQVTTCSQCPGGAPRRWELTGFLSSNQGTSFGLYNNSKLSYVSGCRWVYTQGDASFALEYTAPNWVLTLSGLEGGTQEFTKAGSGWACLNSNVMTGAALNPDSAPASMVLTPVATNAPGNIYVEKYGESDFLRLRIPVNIGP